MLFANKESLAAELLCAICSDPWDSSKAASCPECDASFCFTCIEDHLAKSAKCPKCGAEHNLAEYSRPARVLRSMSDREVKVYCPNRPKECWTGPRVQLASHLSECPYDPRRVQFVGDAPEELQCPICTNVAQHPMTCGGCETVFCMTCIRLALTRKEECPHCCVGLTEDTLVAPRRAVLSLFDNLAVKCTSGCGWEGPRRELEPHFGACPNRAAPAPTPVAAPAATPAPAGTAPREVPPVVVAPAPAPVAAAAAVPAGASMTLVAKSLHPVVHAADSNVGFVSMAHIQAPATSDAMTAKRKTLQVSAVMDISGSMAGEKIALAKEALAFVVAELAAEDRFGLIAFDDRVEEVCTMCTMSEAGKSGAAAAIASLKDRGSTNLSGGLFAGIEQARDMPFVDVCDTTARKAKIPARSPPRSVANSSAPSLMARMTSMFSSAPAPVAHDRAEFTASYTMAKVKRDGVWKYRYTVTIELHDDATKTIGNFQVMSNRGAKIAGTRNGNRIVCMGADLTSAVPKFSLTPTLTNGATVASFEFITPEDEEEGSTRFVMENGTTTPVPTNRSPAKSPVPASVSRVVMLFTDGQANCGITGVEELVAATRKKLGEDAAKDVTVFTFGFGSGHNASLLQAIAESSQGTYYFVKEAAQMKEIFADCLGGLLSIVATGLQLAIRPALGVKIERVMTQFPTSADANGVWTVKIKDLYGEEQRDILVQTSVAPRKVGGAAPIVSYVLTCENVVLGAAQTVTAETSVPTVADAYTGSPDVAVDQQLNRFKTTEALEQARKLADEGRVAEANMCVKQVAFAMQGAYSAETDYTRALRRDLDQAVAFTESESMWNREGQKQVNRMKSSHAQQRANCVDEADDDAYGTSAKKAMRSKARK